MPDGWRRLAIEEMACQRTEKIRPSRDDRTPYVALEHIPSGGGRLLGVDVAGSAMSHKTLFLAGDTLFGKLRPNLRKVVRATFDGVCSTDILAVTPKDGTDAAFLYQLLASDIVYRHVMGDITGTKMPRTSWERLADFSVSCPPLPEQRAIAAVLDAVDDTIERTEAVIAATEELRRALLHELLTRGVPGMHSEWKHVPGVGTVPACWEVATLGEVCERPEYGAGAPAIAYDPRLPRYVRITDLTDDGRLRADEPRSADPVETAGFELQPGDLLFARSGATVGKTYLYREEDGPCVYAGYLIRFRAKSESVNPDFLELWTRGGLYERWVASMFRAGAQPNINATEYASLPLAVPNPSEQGQIVEVLAAIRERLDASRRALTRLAQAKAGLSDALLSGRIRPAAPAEVSA